MGPVNSTIIRSPQNTAEDVLVKINSKTRSYTRDCSSSYKFIMERITKATSIEINTLPKTSFLWLVAQGTLPTSNHNLSITKGCQASIKTLWGGSKGVNHFFANII